MGSPLDPWRAACLLLTVAAVGLAGCGGGDGGGSSTSGGSSVSGSATSTPSSSSSSSSSSTTSPSSSTTPPSSTSGAEAPASGEVVTIKDFAYSPINLTVAKGTTVLFSNEDKDSHTATSSKAGAFDTGTIKPDGLGEVTLDKVGTFTYYCRFHSFMRGTITVKP